VDSFFKPDSLARDFNKWERRSFRAKLKATTKRALEAAWRALSEEVSTRDRGSCRICTCQTIKWGKGDPRLWGGAHHIVYRSAGGLDTLSNLIWICRQCHALEHEHRIQITGTAEALCVVRLDAEFAGVGL
jgi:5-methylcytosine-specific restriction endonuclease McrA